MNEGGGTSPDGLYDDPLEEDSFLAGLDDAIMNQPHIKGLFLTAYILVFLFCVFGNLVILFVIVSNKAMRTSTNFFLANLAIADFLVGIFCVFQNAAHFVIYEHGIWPFGEILCHTYIYFLHMLPNASAGILVLLSIERFIAVVRPMIVQDLLTTRVLLRCVLLVWIGSAVMNLPYLYAVQYFSLFDPESGTKQFICARQFLKLGDVNLLQVVTTVNLFVWYVIPLAMLMVIYITIGIVLLGTTKTNSVVRSTLERKATTTSLLTKDESVQIQSMKPLTNEALDSRKRVIRLVIVLVLAFAILSLPRHMYLIWSTWRDTNAPRCLNCLAALIQPATFLLYFFNSGLNPLLYAFLSRRFRSAILDTFHHCFCFKIWGQRKTSGDAFNSHTPPNRSLQKNSYRALNC